MVKNINIGELFLRSRVNAFLREQDPNQWEEVYEKISFQPINYKSSMLDYELSYQISQGGRWHDYSSILFLDSKPVGIWPVTVSVCNGVTNLSSQGRLLMPPLFISELPERSRKRLTKACLSVACHLVSQLGIARWKSIVGFCDRCDIDEWQLIAMNQGAHSDAKFELYVDLSLDLSEIRAKFRKRFRSLVTAGERQWNIEIIRSSGSYDVWEEFRQLHFDVSGRRTRSLNTWQLQYDAIKTDQAFLVVLRNLDNHMIGGGYFQFTRDEGSYRIGAYDRRLFDKPLGHVVQYRAIEALKQRGCRWYHIGTRCFPGEDPMPSKKELNISNFKQGFSSHLFASFVLTHFC